MEKINDKDISLKNIDDLNKLESAFKASINERINELMSRAKEHNCDILNFKKVVYLSKPNTDLNQDIDYKVNINLNINRGGSLYEELT